MKSPELDHNMGNMDDISNSFGQWETQYDMNGFTSYPQQLSNAFGGMHGGAPALTMDPLDGMDVETMQRDFNTFIQVMS